jgi:endogenous inhibitor of DNA gyrase (YacG/DUF329 family)
MLCSNCQKSVAFDLSKMPAHFPFCSMRCKALDLGMWLEPEEDEDEDLDEANRVVASDLSEAESDEDDSDEAESDEAESEDLDSGGRPEGP